MKREIEIIAGKERAVALLLDEKAPKTCDAIWNSLPIISTATHAKISGEEIMLMIPLFIDIENPTSNPDPGDICYWPSGQDVCIYYGEITSFLGAVTKFAKVSEGLEVIKMIGRRNWFKQGEKIEIKRKEE